MLTIEQAVNKLGTKVDPRDGKPITKAKIKEYLLNKEKGRISILEKFRTRKGIKVGK